MSIRRSDQIEGYFGSGIPTDDGDVQKTLTLSEHYRRTAQALFTHCPENADRAAALRLLKQSFDTAKGSIVCADTLQL